MHPVINITHLERYHPSPDDLGQRSKKNLTRLDFEALPEYEVEEIIGERMTRKAGKRAIREYRVRFKGYGPSDDQWLNRYDLKNAPEILENWKLGKDAREIAADD